MSSLRTRYVLTFAVISIPVIVLRKACISRGQKLGVVIVLCLAAAAVVAPIIGLAVYLNYRALDVTWITFWLFAEGAIWLIMTCVLSFRALFVKASDRLEQSDKRGRRRLFRKTPPKELPVSYLDPITPNGAPSTPQHSIRSHFKRRDSSIGGKSTMQSQADMGDLPPLPLKGNEIYVSRVFQIQSNRVSHQSAWYATGYSIADRGSGYTRGLDDFKTLAYSSTKAPKHSHNVSPDRGNLPTLAHQKRSWNMPAAR